MSTADVGKTEADPNASRALGDAQLTPAGGSPPIATAVKVLQYHKPQYPEGITDLLRRLPWPSRGLIAAILLTTAASIWLIADHATWTVVRPFHGQFPGYPVPEDVLSADGTRLASILSGGNTIHIFDVATGKTVRHLYCPKASNRVVALSPDGSRIWANENDGSAILWNASTGLPVAIFARPPRRTSRGIDWLGPGGASPFSPDGRFVAATGAGAMLVIDARTGAVAKRLDNSYFPAFSSDSRYLAAVSSPPRTALIWDTRSWARIGTIAAGAPGIWGGETLGFSPDGKILAVAAANRIDFWNAATRHISTAYKCGLPIIAFLFSPDGRFLFLAAAGSRSVTWDIASGKQIAILRDGMILPAISPDGTVATDGMFMCSFPSLVPISYSGYGSAIAWLPGGEEFLQNAPDSSHILPLRRRRPDAWYGFLWLPQGCLTLLGACVSIWYLRRDLRHWRRDAPFVF